MSEMNADRAHVALNVSDLDRAVAFYRALFGVEPAKHYKDYAKFEIQDPPFVLSLEPLYHRASDSFNHMGLRLADVAAVKGAEARLKAAGLVSDGAEDVECCYSRQTKFWLADPDRRSQHPRRRNIEAGVAEPKAERVKRFGRAEEIAAVRGRLMVIVHRQLADRASDGHRQFPAWIDLPEQDIGDRMAHLAHGLSSMLGGHPAPVGHPVLQAGSTTPADMTLVAALALLGVGTSIAYRRRFGIWVSLVALTLAVGVVVTPQGRLWNARLLPFMYLSVFLLAAIAVGELARSLAVLTSRDPERPSRVVGLSALSTRPPAS